MKSYRKLAGLGIGLCAVLLMTACGGASAGNPGTPTTTQPAATAKPKPTALPPMTMAFCQSILTLGEANQIMKSAHVATTIRIDAPSSGGGSCNYEYAPYKGIVSVDFVNVIPDGVTPNADTLATQIQSEASSVEGAKITTQPISGVGDVAVFAAGSASLAGQPYKFDALDIVYGRVFFDVNVPLLGPDATAASDSALLASYTQVAKLVMSRW